MREGHDEPCYYCGGKCDRLAGNPGEWPIPLSHSDDPGVVKWHHARCISLRLHENDRLRELLREGATHITVASELITQRPYDEDPKLDDAIVKASVALRRIGDENARLRELLREAVAIIDQYGKGNGIDAYFKLVDASEAWVKKIRKEIQ